MPKIHKLSNLTGNQIQKLNDFVILLDRDVANIIDYIGRTPKTYIQADEPTIESDSFAFWKDTDDSKFYLLKNIGGDQKKVELT